MQRRIFLAAPLLALAPRAARASERVVVLAGLQATFSIATALARNTAIEVLAAFPADTGMAEQADWLARRTRTDFMAAARRADAVIGIRAVWPADPLYPEVRRRNIHAIEIDASASFQPELAGVATLATPAGDGARREASPFIWLSLTNAVRMTDIAAADLKRLNVPDAAQIERNQADFRGAILALRGEYEARLAAFDDPAAILLAPALRYLLSDMAVRIAAVFAKSDVDWTADDRTVFAAAFKRSGTQTVVAAQPPVAGIAAMITALGGKLAVLDTLDPGLAMPDGSRDPDGLLRGLRGNLAALSGALTG